jgi:hypothetical protein
MTHLRDQADRLLAAWGQERRVRLSYWSSPLRFCMTLYRVMVYLI